MDFWIAVIGMAAVTIVWGFYEVKRRALRIPILVVLHERGVLNVTGIIKAMREKEVYPSRTPDFLVKSACQSAIKAGLITLGGHAIIPRFTISNKGQEFLDQYLWRKGKVRFPER